MTSFRSVVLGIGEGCLARPHWCADAGLFGLSAHRRAAQGSRQTLPGGFSGRACNDSGAT